MLILACEDRKTNPCAASVGRRKLMLGVSAITIHP
jgi:hypothetical protein